MRPVMRKQARSRCAPPRVARQVDHDRPFPQEIALLEALRIAPDGYPDHIAKATGADDQHAAGAMGHVLARLVHDRRHDAGRRQDARASTSGGVAPGRV